MRPQGGDDRLASSHARKPSMTVTPKQANQHSQRTWYPYYAGFRPAFALDLLTTMTKRGQFVIDPWNGAGTTTAVASQAGRMAAGIDINPALTVISRARLTPYSLASSLSPLAKGIADKCLQLGLNQPSDNDLLLRWIRPKSVAIFRSLEASMLSMLQAGPEVPLLTLDQRVARADGLVPFFYSAFFLAGRKLLNRFRASNPTWIRAPKTPQHRVAPSRRAVSEAFLQSVEALSSQLEKPAGLVGAATVETGDAGSLSFPSSTFDAAISSPPYATRIDYVTNALVELALLGASVSEIEQLRQNSTGGPVVKGVISRPRSAIESTYALRVLDSIDSHDSKGSSNYYLPWMTNYLQSLQDGLSELARVVKAGRPIAIVAQDSHYKDVHVDLQRVVIELMASKGRTLDQRHDFVSKNHLAKINPAAREHLPMRASHESVLVFR